MFSEKRAHPSQLCNEKAMEWARALHDQEVTLEHFLEDRLVQGMSFGSNPWWKVKSFVSDWVRKHEEPHQHLQQVLGDEVANFPMVLT